MKVTCADCGKTWTGLAREHCASCHRTFNSTAAGDKHRTGKHGVTEGPDARRCRTPMEMLDKGMWRDDAGVWYASRDTRQHAPHTAPEESLSAERGEAAQP